MSVSAAARPHWEIAGFEKLFDFARGAKVTGAGFPFYVGDGAKLVRALLQFFLNHRRFLRSEHPKRVGRSPAELLHGEAHPHWLEMLGYSRFSRN